LGKNTVTRFKWWWAWNYEEHEQWLTNMSQLGYKMVRSRLGVFYTFEAGNFEEYVYKIDYKRLSGKKLYDYIQLFNDCGWEYVDSFVGWHYFRKKDNSIGLPELYTDSESKSQMFKQLLGTMVALLVIYIPILIFFIYALIDGKISPGRNNETIGIFILDIAIYTFDTLFFAYVFKKLMTKYKKLKKKYL
jgi:hypothetical protein